MPAATGRPGTCGRSRPQASAVLAQAEVDGKTNEITAFAAVLAPLDLTGAVVTAGIAAALPAGDPYPVAGVSHQPFARAAKFGVGRVWTCNVRPGARTISHAAGCPRASGKGLKA
jgi:hypothetical protein